MAMNLIKKVWTGGPVRTVEEPPQTAFFVLLDYLAGVPGRGARETFAVMVEDGRLRFRSPTPPNLEAVKYKYRARNGPAELGYWVYRGDLFEELPAQWTLDLPLAMITDVRIDTKEKVAGFVMIEHFGTWFTSTSRFLVIGTSFGGLPATVVFASPQPSTLDWLHRQIVEAVVKERETATRATNAETASSSKVCPDCAETASSSKVCPDCAETVLAAARICRFCRHEFAAD